MTEAERHIIRSLDNCRLKAFSWSKSFIRNMAALEKSKPETVLSENQKEWLLRMVFMYRKQLPSLYALLRHIPECSKKDNSKPARTDTIVIPERKQPETEQLKLF